MTTDDHAARLARLQSRRSPGIAASSEAPTPTVATEPTVTPTPTVATEPTVATPSPAPGRRRSPALSAKVLTVGASTTAMLGMMAGYGIAEGRADQTPTLQSGTTDSTGALTAAPAPIPTTLATTPTTSPPQVIVVVIDGATGRPIDTDAVTRAAIDGEPAGGVPEDSDAPLTTAAEPATTAASTDPPPPAQAPAAAHPPAAPEPATAAPQPIAVDVPTPVPVAAPAPVDPAPAPQPEATSSGS